MSKIIIPLHTICKQFIYKDLSATTVMSWYMLNLLLHSSSSFSSLFQVVYVVLSLCVGLLCELKFGQEEVCTRILGAVEGDSAILFGKVFLWVLVLLFTACAQRHHSQARSRGYLRFYRKMQGLKYLPVHVHSAGTTAWFYCRCR